MQSVQQLTLIVAGPQGSGKGTQISLLKERIAAADAGAALVHFEMGQTLRELAQKDNYTGRRTKEILAGGNLIPYAISASSFAQKLMDGIVTGREHLIIDGFPRTADQVPMLDSTLRFFERTAPTVVVINISDEEAVKRLMLRGRGDDTAEGIRKRLEWSRQETMPNIEWFRTQDYYRVVDINGEQSVEDVQREIVEKLGL